MKFPMKKALLFLPYLLLLAACSEAPKPAETAQKEPTKPPEPVSGRYAFHQMFSAARQWAPDVQALHLRCIHLKEVKSEGGKCPAWEAAFVSPSRAQARVYTYSVIEAGGSLHKGHFAGSPEAYAGPRGQAKPFLVAALKTDSTEVYETALKKSEDFVKKNPAMPVSFLLELTPRFPDPAWRVIWGESVATSSYSVFVDASTGDFLQRVR